VYSNTNYSAQSQRSLTLLTNYDEEITIGENNLNFNGKWNSGLNTLNDIGELYSPDDTIVVSDGSDNDSDAFGGCSCAIGGDSYATDLSYGTDNDSDEMGGSYAIGASNQTVNDSDAISDGSHTIVGDSYAIGDNPDEMML